MGKNNRVIYMDVLRIISIFAVITIHVGSQLQNLFDKGVPEWNVYNIYVSLSRFSVPIFVMISGYFFLNPKKEIKISTLFRKYIGRLVIAFLFWSFIYAVATTNSAILSGRPESILIVAKRTIEGHAQYWYLYMLVGLYIITPFLKRMLALISKKELEYFLLLSFVFSGIVPYLGYFHNGFLQETSLIMNKFQLTFVSGYVFYFVLGHYIGTYEITKRLRRGSYILGLLGVFATIYGSWYFDVKINQNGAFFQDNLTVFIIFYSIAVFMFVKERFKNIQISEKKCALISSISQHTFGMYLCHDCFNMLYYKLGIWNNLRFSAWLAVPLFVIIDAVGSFVIVTIMKRIPILKKTVM
ncbi:acyltransferase [Anaerosacchariphilus polymeriproducens]|uniref:Acyltransferase 3 domain-containing protein n=1 Tax=Anaerosacchariphilus polymeriproducens TaxID=1812858 RepID=A0A371AUP5_9FIRM|nr:acyltransferase family protein [Anaerosacchariphilus polymeriproducens]RDU23287.1 hypothetical protein DWV06_10290 [Anaerosacchariphilus polymeriproducens]